MIRLSKMKNHILSQLLKMNEQTEIQTIEIYLFTTSLFKNNKDKNQSIKFNTKTNQPNNIEI